MISNQYLIKLLKHEIKKTYKIYWSCYDWKHEGIRPIFTIIEDININYKQRKWCKNKIKLLKKNILPSD